MMGIFSQKLSKSGIRERRKALTRLRLPQMSSSAILPRVVPTKNGCATSLTSQLTKDFHISLALMDVWS